MNTVPPYQVLIVDDNPEFVKNFRNLILGVCGSVVDTVHYSHNGTEGLALMRDHAYHFVFMDIDMPGVDGITATRTATAQYHQTDTQIIAISFHTEHTFRNQMLRAGASMFLAKDEIDADELSNIFGMNDISLI
jgi:CheY-like chemotaxis protein